MLGLILQGMGFGFNAGVLPGPLQSFLISTTLGYGWRRGIMVVFSPLVTDAPIIIVMTLFLNQLPGGVIRAIQIGGGLFVLWLAWGSWRAYREGRLTLGAAPDQDEGPPPTSARRILLQASGINYLSPGPYIFWGSVTGPLLVEALDQSALHVVAFLCSFYGVFLGVMALLVWLFDRLRRLDESITRRVLLAAIVVMALLGAQLVVQGALG